MRRAPLALIAAALVWAGCHRAAGSHGYEYMPDMARSIAYDAFAPNPVTRDGLTWQAPVAGTVARGARPFRYAATPEEAERAGRELVNPFPATPEILAQGEHVYRTFCQVCHGATGQGDGPIIPKFPNPPSYTSERLLAMPEGHMFHVVTLGTSVMPSYAAQISADDRWRVLRYVESLQGPARQLAQQHAASRPGGFPIEKAPIEKASIEKAPAP